MKYQNGKVATYQDPDDRPASGREGDPGAPWEATMVDDDAYADGAMAIAVAKRLREAKSASGQPLFFALGFLKPHLPFVAPKK